MERQIASHYSNQFNINLFIAYRRFRYSCTLLLLLLLLSNYVGDDTSFTSSLHLANSPNLRMDQQVS